MPTLQLNDLALHYQQFGQGAEAVLALHPSTVGGSLFQWAVPKNNRFTVILPDQRGHGKTPNPAPDFHLYRFVNDMINLLDALEIEQFHGIGYSLGGAVLLGMVQKIPERFKSLVVIGASHVAPDEKQQTALTGSVEKRQGLVKSIMDRETGIRSGWEFDVDYMWEMKNPASIVVGDRDEVVTVPVAHELYQSFPQGQLFVLPNCHHFGYHSSPILKEHLDSFYSQL